MGRAMAKTIGGTVVSRDGVLSVKGADEATIYVSIATNFKHYDDIQRQRHVAFGRIFSQGFDEQLSVDEESACRYL